MPTAMVTAGLIMYLSMTVFFTFGLTKYPRSVRGYLIGMVPSVFLEHLIIAKCAAAHFVWLEPVLASMVIGTLGAATYLHQSKVFELKK